MVSVNSIAQYHTKNIRLQITESVSFKELTLFLARPNSICQVIQNLFCRLKANASIRNALPVGELRQICRYFLISLNQVTLNHHSHQML